LASLINAETGFAQFIDNRLRHFLIVNQHAFGDLQLDI